MRLRSAGEELVTSREELQSVNEELQTVNQELKSRVEELSHTNSDLQNLMAATDIATVFLDRELRIKRYTPSAVVLFNFIPSDLGRPLFDLTHRLDYPGIDADARAAVVKQTLDGAVRSLSHRVHDVADAAETQAETVARLRADVDRAYTEAVAEIEKASADGTLLRGEVLARWQEFVGTGELLRNLETKVGWVRDRVVGWVKGKPQQVERVTVAVESGLELLLLEIEIDQGASDEVGEQRSGQGVDQRSPNQIAGDIPHAAEHMQRSRG